MPPMAIMLAQEGCQRVLLTLDNDADDNCD